MFLEIYHNLTPIIEVIIIAVILNFLLSLIWNTRSMDLVLGFLLFLFVFGASSWFNLPVLHQIMVLIGQVAIVAIIIIFQPEIRVALARLSLKGKRIKEITEFDKFLDQLAHSTYKLAEKRIGALIALENKDSLEEYAQKAVLLSGLFSSELLETIFAPGTPLHDGAIIVRENSIIAAAAILPLADDPSQLTKAMGTRHRAALGLSNLTDALVIVISEETGKVSIAREGIITRGIKIDRFKGIIRSIFTPPPNQMGFSFKSKLKEWIKR